VGTLGMNLFKGHVRGGEWHGENFGGFPTRRDLDDGTAVTLTVRPESIRLDNSGVEARIEEVTPYFAEHFQLVQAKAGRETFAFTVGLAQQLRVGHSIRCALDP